MSPTPDSALADPQQVIAELRRELAEMQGRLGEALAERDEGEAKKVAMTEVLQVINSSPGNLAPLFDAILERATRLCDAAFGHLSIYDGELIHAMAIHGASPEHAELLRSRPYRPEPGTALYDLVQGAPYLHEADIRQSETYRSGVGGRRILADLAGARTALWMSLRKESTLLGVFTIYRQEVRPFSEKEIALLESFAAPAVIALENARLLGELRGRTRDLQESLDYQIATSDVLKVISRSTFDLQLVLDTLVEIAVRLCKADMGALSIRESNLYRAAANFGFFPEHKAFAQTQPRSRGRGSVVTRALLGRRPVHVLDIASDPEHSAPEMVTLGNMRTVLGVPLLREGKPIGVIGLSRSRVEAFTEQQIELVSTFADQVVIAIENARLLTETREALEQQTATAEVLQVINSSPGDLAPVFDAILEKAHALCGAPLGSLVLCKGEQLCAVATRGYPQEYEAMARRGFSPTPAFTRLMKGEPFVRGDPFPLTPRPLSEDDPMRRAAVEIAGIRTALFVPLRKDATVLGYISAQRKEVQPFSDKQIALLQNFAAQAVIAMENARLLGELRQRTSDLQESLEYQTATSDVLKVISRSTFELQPVLDTLVETAARLCEADRGLITRQDGEVYRVVATFAVTPEFDAYLRGLTIVPNRESVTGRIVLERQVVHIDDLARDPEYAMPVSDFTQGAHTVLGVPLMREGQPIGAIVLARHRVEPFTSRQIELVRTFSDQAVIAMENARLLGELRQRTDEVGELNRGLEARVAEQVDELGRVGRLKRFLAPQLAELIVSQHDERILESHRREIVVVFCDLRGYTAFTETAEPEEVLDFLRQYHGALGPLVSQFEGTLDQFSGDGIMVFFNDPVPCPDPAERAVKMAMAMREVAGTLIAAWRRRGRMLGFGAGIAQGYATLGQIGFADRSGYTAIGTVCNLAARLCAEAKDGQILIAQLVAVAVEETTPLEEVGELTLKGLTQPVVAYNVPLQAAQPVLRVIEGGGPQSV